jgi:hypothetical protein
MMSGLVAMFAVEVCLRDEDRLVGTMETMRTWLDHRRFEPATFRYSFAPAGIAVRVDFPVESEAAEFARAFQGKLLAEPQTL